MPSAYGFLKVICSSNPVLSITWGVRASGPWKIQTISSSSSITFSPCDTVYHFPLDCHHLFIILLDCLCHHYSSLKLFIIQLHSGLNESHDTHILMFQRLGLFAGAVLDVVDTEQQNISSVPETAQFLLPEDNSKLSPPFTSIFNIDSIFTTMVSSIRLLLFGFFLIYIFHLSLHYYFLFLSSLSSAMVI